MSTPLPRSDLGGKSYLTVIVRLLVDEHGALVHGEVADLQGASQQRFAGWDDMIRAVRACLADSAQGKARL